MKRQLTDKEKRFALKNLEILKGDVEYLEKVEIPKKQFVLDTADIEVKKQKNDLRLTILMLENELKEKKETIAILEKQIKEGVDVIEETENVKDVKIKENKRK